MCLGTGFARCASFSDGFACEPALLAPSLPFSRYPIPVPRLMVILVCLSADGSGAIYLPCRPGRKTDDRGAGPYVPMLLPRHGLGACLCVYHFALCLRNRLLCEAQMVAQCSCVAGQLLRTPWMQLLC